MVDVQRREQIQPLDVVVLRGSLINPMSYIIMQRTSTLWTHAVTYRGNGNIYDATMHGVQINKLTAYKGRKCAVLRYHQDIPQQKKITMVWKLDQLAKDSHPYDFLALLGFITGWKALEDSAAWYCSEIPYWIYEQSGYQLFNQKRTFVYPSDLYLCNDFKIVYEGKV